MNAIFEKVANEQIHNAESQKYKYNYTYTVSAVIPPATTKPSILSIEQDADFLFEKMTGSVLGPCDSNGVPTVSATDFPKPGIAAGAGHAGRGVTVEITDTGSSRNLTSGAVPVETILTPGYGDTLHLPYPIKYFANRNSKIKFNFTNRDTKANANHLVDIAINGYKFMMPETSSSLHPANQIRQNAQTAG